MGRELEPVYAMIRISTEQIGERQVDMSEKGKKDKGGRETKKKAKMTIKEKRKLKREKSSTGKTPSSL